MSNVVTMPFSKRTVLHSTMLAALGSGLIGGVLFAFSSFVMKGLDALPVSQGIAAMQSINVAVINPLFMGVLLGTAALCVMLAIYALNDGIKMAVCIFSLEACFLFGALLVTMLCNVPLNNALAQIDVANRASAEERYSILIVPVAHFPATPYCVHLLELIRPGALISVASSNKLGRNPTPRVLPIYNSQLQVIFASEGMNNV